MNILGLDFTSAPKRKKPILAAMGTLHSDLLTINSLRVIPDFGAFEALLDDFEGIGGYDFPFSEAVALSEYFQWGTTWTEIVSTIGAMPLHDFEALLKQYQDAHPPGQKEVRRPCDRIARSASPMKTVNPPVARMFYRGAPRLLKHQVSIFLCRPLENAKHIVLEIYPALAARCIIGRRPYKSDTKKKQTPERLSARTEIVDNLERLASECYGLRLEIDATLRLACISDASGDTLDSVLAAIITGWAATAPNYGIPPIADPREGWIIDPSTLLAANSL